MRTAWAALEGRLDGAALPELLAWVDQRRAAGACAPEADGKRADPKAWRKSMAQWRKIRARASSKDGSYERGLELVAVLAAMPQASRRAIVHEESSALFGFAEDLLDAASRACDMSDPEWAKQETSLHLRYCAELGEPVSPRALQEAASRSTRCAWWEIAAHWGSELSEMACEQAKASGQAWDDEQAQGMCDVVGICAGKALLGCMGKTGLDPRGLASWELCCSWPWPERELTPQTLQWVGRKWRDSLFFRPEGIEEALASLPAVPTWADVVMAKLLVDNPASLAAYPEAQQGLALLRSMFMASREHRALAVYGVGARSSGGRSKAL